MTVFKNYIRVLGNLMELFVFAKDIFIALNTYVSAKKSLKELKYKLEFGQ